jgi:hypothetical protein
MMKLLSIGTVLLLALARTDHPDAASLGGRVTDENMAAIPSATISVRNVFSGDVEFARSDFAGRSNLSAQDKGGTRCTPWLRVMDARGYSMCFYFKGSAHCWIWF